MTFQGLGRNLKFAMGLTLIFSFELNACKNNLESLQYVFEKQRMASSNCLLIVLSTNVQGEDGGIFFHLTHSTAVF